MIDRSHSLPLARQARELGISRGSVYYLPRPVPVADLAIMRRIDELHLEFPFAGSRMLRDLLRLRRPVHRQSDLHPLRRPLRRHGDLDQQRQATQAPTTCLCQKWARR